MPAATIDRMLRQADLPTLPEMYFELGDVINDPHSSASSSAAAISAIISKEPALAARLLDIANSVMFRFPARIDSISAAVHAIGMAQIHDLALSVMAMEMLEDIDPEIVSAESYWHHSIACAIAARTLAAYRHESNIERFFAAGLLHDTGSLLFYGQIPEQALMAVLHGRDGDGPLHELEQAVAGFNHAQLGGALLKAWRLPQALEQAVALHHAPELAMDYPVEAAVVHVADIIINAMEIGSRGEYVVPPLVPVAWERIGLPADVLQSVMEQVDRQFVDMVNTFYV